MVKRDAVKSLAELRQRKHEIELESEITKRELAHNLGTVRTDLQSYVVKRFALPVGGSALALFLLKKLILDKRSSRATTQAEEGPALHATSSSEESSSIDIAKIIKIAVPIIQAGMGFMAGYSKKEEEEEA